MPRYLYLSFVVIITRSFPAKRIDNAIRHFLCDLPTSEEQSAADEHYVDKSTSMIIELIVSQKVP